jgi:hypothetical protein
MDAERITFHNKADIRVQAQIYTGRTLVSTCLAQPGEIHTLQCGSVQHDIYLRDASTGWELARKQDNDAATVVLSRRQGHYVLTEN